MDAATLKGILEHVPDDYEIVFVDHKHSTYMVQDKVEVDVSGKRLILKS